MGAEQFTHIHKIKDTLNVYWDGLQVSRLIFYLPSVMKGNSYLERQEKYINTFKTVCIAIENTPEMVISAHFVRG